MVVPTLGWAQPSIQPIDAETNSKLIGLNAVIFVQLFNCSTVQRIW